MNYGSPTFEIIKLNSSDVISSSLNDTPFVEFEWSDLHRKDRALTKGAKHPPKVQITH